MPILRSPGLDARSLADLTYSEPADLLIIGGGIAGMCAALEAPAGARIVVLDKGEAEAGSSPLAQGGMAAAVGPGDSPELHASDTIAAGAGLCVDDIVRDICAEGPLAVSWLRSRGVLFDLDARGELHVAREGAQSVARSIHAKDASGAEVVRGLREALKGRGVTRVRARATSLLVGDGYCVGAVAEGVAFPATTTLLATGGAGGLWGRTTNQPGAVADGAVLALLAGEPLVDLEFMQFHPTALAVGGFGQRVLLTEALRGEGALLLDAKGERFVDELAPRHVVAKAILDAGEAFLDCRSISNIEEQFPTVASAVRSRGFDIATQPIPVEPAAHYFIGGVATDAFGRTTTEGLFAAGEAASTGFDGANRMAGNSLLQAVVVGRRVGRQIQLGGTPRLGEPTRGSLTALPEGLSNIIWDAVGPIRSATSIELGNKALSEFSNSPHVTLGSVVLAAANSRIETRGTHVRSDYPESDPSQAERQFVSVQIGPSDNDV